jgi:hypothetical protein
MMNEASNINPQTRQAIRSALDAAFATAEAIREAGEIPSGHLYALMMPVVGIQGYESIIRTLKNAGLVTEQRNMLRWIGPEVRS